MPIKNIHNKKHFLESIVSNVYAAISCHYATVSQNFNFAVKLKIAPCKSIAFQAGFDYMSK